MAVRLLSQIIVDLYDVSSHFGRKFLQIDNYYYCVLIYFVALALLMGGF